MANGIDVPEDRRLAVETLYKEFLRIQAKSAATDDWFFRFLSIAVVPFLAFLAYCLVTPAYRLFVAALPMLSLIGVLVVCVLVSHYLYANSYCTYLQHRINRLLDGKIMRDEHFGPKAYSGFTPVTVSFIFGFVLLIALNILAVPIIDRTVVEFHRAHRQELGMAGVLLEHYWAITITSVSIVVIAAGGSLGFAAWRLAKALRKQDESDADPPAAAPAEPGGLFAMIVALFIAMSLVRRRP